MKCEDYPCCGHEDGGCPDEEGRFRCICGTLMPPRSKYSICLRCLSQAHLENEPHRFEWED